ncbi:translation initiation factor IF-2 [Pyronema domesticum]|nr:translation initiation factor IF-2 [Pyronema domesticum]
MLRTSKSAVNRPTFTYTFCALKSSQLLRVSNRQLHSNNSNNSNNGSSTPPRPNMAPPSFGSLFAGNSKAAESIASKWNLPSAPVRNTMNAQPGQPPRTGSAITRPGDRGGNWGGPAVTRPGERGGNWTGPAVTRPQDRPQYNDRQPYQPRDRPQYAAGRADRGTPMPGRGPPAFERGAGRGGYQGRDSQPRQSGYGRGQDRNDRFSGPDRRGDRRDRFANAEPIGRDRFAKDAPAAAVSEDFEDVRDYSDHSTPSRGKEAGRISQKKALKSSKDRSKNRLVDEDDESYILDESEISAKELKKQKKAAKRAPKQELIPIFLPQFISVENLASILNVRVEKFTKQLQQMGFDHTNNNHVLNAEEAGLIAGEYGFEPTIDRGDEIDLKQIPLPEDKSVLPARPPVVTIMGHVDHGKTTLLDWLRKSSIVDGEHGGITQHIGAFSVTMPSGKIITFLDTPGHAAFLSMRERGANVTDIVILVVAADDSVKPQTLEAVKHAKAANVPMIVAINKIDKSGANIDKVIGDLARYGVEVEDLGGDTQTVKVSGKTGQGMEDLEEAVIALSEMLDHRAPDDGQIEGWVLEATTKKKGRVATVLVTRGTLRPGDIVVAGKTWAKVKTMTNEHGDEVEFASPGTPVEIDGWRDQPEAGDIAISTETEDRAKEVVDYRELKANRIRQSVDMDAINAYRRSVKEKEEREETIRREAIAAGEDPEKAILEDERARKNGETKEKKEVRLIVKADVSGSVEAVVASVQSLGNHEVGAKVLRSSFGPISEFDVDHASAAGACLVAFNLHMDPTIYQYARAKKVKILSHNVIYHLVDAVRDELSALLPPKITQTVTGEAEVLAIFNINIGKKKTKPIAGCRVKNGTIETNKKVRVMRYTGKTIDGERQKEMVYDGDLGSLKNVKKDVDEMKKDTDCGIGFVGWGDFKEGDMVVCYEVKEEKRTLENDGM